MIRGAPGEIEQFRAAIEAAGLVPPAAIVADGKLHRFATSARPADDAGWYVFHDDNIPAGAFGDWRTGTWESWRADIGRRLSLREEAAHRAHVETIRRAREAEDARRKAEALERAAEISGSLTGARRKVGFRTGSSITNITQTNTARRGAGSDVAMLSRPVRFRAILPPAQGIGFSRDQFQESDIKSALSYLQQ